MEDKVRKQKFLQLQFCMLLLMCTLLPDLGSLLGLPDLDIPVFCCQVFGVVGGALALYAFYQEKGKELPVPFLYLAGGGLALGLLALIPGLPEWLDYIGLIALLIALFMSKNSLSIQWNSPGSQGAYLILIAILLHVYDSIGDSVLTHIAALVGLILYFIGLGQLKEGLDEQGRKGISRLKVAVVLGLIAVIFGWIPLLGTIVAGILLMVAFVFEFLGYGAMKQSVRLGPVGQTGAGKLQISMIILLVGAFIDLFPLTGIVVGFIALIALWFVFQGWSMVLFGVENPERQDGM